jgi:hypothetical protein
MRRYDATDTHRAVARPAGRATLRHIFYQGATPSPYERTTLPMSETERPQIDLDDGMLHTGLTQA